MDFRNCSFSGFGWTPGPEGFKEIEQPVFLLSVYRDTYVTPIDSYMAWHCLCLKSDGTTGVFMASDLYAN